MLTFNTNKITEMDELTPDYAYQARTGNRIDQSQLLIWKQWASNPDLIRMKMPLPILRNIRGTLPVNTSSAMPYSRIRTATVK